MHPRFAVALGALALSLAWVIPASAISVTVSPENPTTEDSVLVSVRGDFATLCWRVEGRECGLAPPETLSVVVSVQYCGGQPACFCGQFPQIYFRSCRFAPLSAGVHVARFTELSLNPLDPEPTASVTLSFTVSAVTPPRRWSWSKVKSFYR